jgi:hypothetical protein
LDNIDKKNFENELKPKKGSNMTIYQLLAILMSDEIKYSDSAFIILNRLKKSSPCLGGVFFDLNIFDSNRNKLVFCNPYLKIEVTPSLHDCVEITTIKHRFNEDFLARFKGWLEKTVI